VAFFFIIAILGLDALNLPWMKFLSITFPSWIRWGRFIFGVCTLVFWIWMQSILGKEWSPQLKLHKEHNLVITGPYAKIWHPIFTATISIGISFALVTVNWVFILFAALTIIILVARVPREEQMMFEEISSEYKEYMQRTKRFLLNKSGLTITKRG
jgi:protein-S-isoprenylcysteine O-methyltransferase Ste14